MSKVQKSFALIKAYLIEVLFLFIKVKYLLSDKFWFYFIGTKYTPKGVTLHTDNSEFWIKQTIISQKFWFEHRKNCLTCDSCVDRSEFGEISVSGTLPGWYTYECTKHYNWWFSFLK